MDTELNVRITQLVRGYEDVPSPGSIIVGVVLQFEHRVPPLVENVDNECLVPGNIPDTHEQVFSWVHDRGSHRQFWLRFNQWE